MISETLLPNLQAWAIQAVVIASIGAVLPTLLRMCHPRSQLVYCHLVLGACLVLPIIQPWQQPVAAVIEGGVPAAVPASGAPQSTPNGVEQTLPWREIVVWIIVAGSLARAGWTAVGLWMIHRRKAGATPLYPLPEAIKKACIRTNTQALFCVSPEGIGPVTFGFVRPVVLLPASFTALNPDAQCGIACHELLHVRRSDWLVTVIEEFVASFFWFNPGFWWLVAQARLAREQLVDAEVVRVTSAREPYIHALLVMASARPGLDVAPVPLFLRRRHLLQRMQLLVTEVSMSKFRVVGSYAAIAAILAAAGWISFTSFPLTGRAAIMEAAALAEPTSRLQTSPGYVVNIQPLLYPREAIEKKIEGTVVVELTFNAAGNIVDARVISGPEELRRAALESALRGSYSIDVARALQVLVEFRLAAVPPPPPPPPPPGEGLKGIVESIEIIGLPEPAATFMRQRLQNFEGQKYSPDLANRLRESAQTNAPASSVVRPLISVRQGTSANTVAIRVVFAVQSGGLQTPFAQRGTRGAVGTPFGVVGGAVSMPILQNALTAIRRVDPVYPALAKQARIQGVVVLHVAVNRQGTVDNIKVVTGHPLLIQAAIDAVKQWQYEPQAENVTTEAVVNFALQ